MHQLFQVDSRRRRPLSLDRSDFFKFSMTVVHKIVLCTCLIFLAMSLILPGLIEVFKLKAGFGGLLPETVEAKNQFRAMNGMMAGMGILALWSCIDFENSRTIVMMLGAVLLVVAAARVYSVFVDGVPGLMSWVYLAIEMVFSAVFLLWPPDK